MILLTSPNLVTASDRYNYHSNLFSFSKIVFFLNHNMMFTFTNIKKFTSKNLIGSRTLRFPVNTAIVPLFS